MCYCNDSARSGIQPEHSVKETQKLTRKLLQAHDVMLGS